MRLIATNKQIIGMSMLLWRTGIVDSDGSEGPSCMVEAKRNDRRGATLFAVKPGPAV